MRKYPAGTQTISAPSLGCRIVNPAGKSANGERWLSSSVPLPACRLNALITTATRATIRIESFVEVMCSLAVGALAWCSHDSSLHLDLRQIECRLGELH